MVKIIFVTMCLLLAQSSYGQYFNPKGSIYVSVCIPTKEKNVAFNRTMEGLFHGDLGYQHAIWKGLTIGGGVNYSFFSINRFALSQTIGTGGMHLPSVHAKLGYEKFTTERVSLYGGIKGGYSSIYVVNDSCTKNLGKAYNTSTPFLELEVALNVLTETDSQDGFNITFGYSFYFKEYTPDFLCRDNFTSLLPEHSDGIIRFFSVGFGYRHYFL